MNSILLVMKADTCLLVHQYILQCVLKVYWNYNINYKYEQPELIQKQTSTSKQN